MILGPDKMLFVLSWVQVLKVLEEAIFFITIFPAFLLEDRQRLAAALRLGRIPSCMGTTLSIGTTVVYFPLLLLGCEKYIQNRKGKVIFPLAVFLTGIYSAYFSYMCLAALGLYLLFRIVMEEGKKWKERILKFLGGCWRIILGLE